MKIFVSYRRADSPQATGRIYDKLVACYGADNVFMDVDSIPLGTDFREVLEESIARCDVLVVVIGRQWLNAVDALGRRRLEDPTDFVRIELEGAFRRRMKIIPLLVDQATAPVANELPGSLQDLAFRNAASIRPDPDFHRDMDRVIQAFESPVVSEVGARPAEDNRPPSPAKYYLYVSRTKIEMLAGQISSAQGSIFQALGSVVRHLDGEGLIGACDQPRAYFRGVMDMHFGDVSFYRGGGRMVLFSGLTEKGTRVGLVGSTAHVVGAPTMDPESLGYARPEFWLTIIESLTPPSQDRLLEQMHDLDNMIDYQARRRSEAPKQKVEFVARQFVARDRFLIGSPLFVAAAD